MNEFTGNVVENIKNEIVELGKKLAITRNGHDFTTYKNLVVAYKEVVKLYQELTDEKFSVPITYNIHVEKVSTGDGLAFIKALESQVKKNK